VFPLPVQGESDPRGNIVLVHEPLQMLFIENDHMVEQIPAAVANPAFSDTVLPRTSEAGPLGLDAEALYRVDDFFIEVRATVKDQVAGRGVIGEGFPQLLYHPRTRRIPGHIAMQDAPTASC